MHVKAGINSVQINSLSSVVGLVVDSNITSVKIFLLKHTGWTQQGGSTVCWPR